MIRGVHIDCRAQKMKCDMLLSVLHDLHDWGYNTILLEYMDAFPFDGKLAALKAPDAFTKEEVKRIVETAAALDIEIIPLVQTFGHLYWVLRHPEFMHLAEGWNPDPETGLMNMNEVCYGSGAMKLSTICPSNPESMELVREMISQMRALHPNSRYFHIGGDEINRPSCPRCKNAMKTMSMPELLASHYAACADAVRELGATPVVWCDILLAYPETLEILKGRLAVMDWDYWSDGKPTVDGGHLWGLTDRIHEPERWPELQRKLFRPYLYEHEPDLIRAFPFTDLLRDLGFEVIIACAARCGGDSFCVPMDIHLRNVPAAVKKSIDSGVTGFVVTSWAIRRSPWPMTEYALMLGAAAADGKDDDSAVRRAFAKRHFGVEDEALGELPQLLGHAAYVAGKDAYFLHSLNEHSDYETGNFFAPDYRDTFMRIHRDELIYKDPDAFVESFNELRAAIPEARERLTHAAPDGKYTHLWHWALNVFQLFCDAVPYIAMQTIDAAADRAAAQGLIERAEAMKPLTHDILTPFYTDFTLIGELQSRFGVLIHGLKRRMGIVYDSRDEKGAE